MKCFIYGITGVLLTMAVLFVLRTQYGDYLAKVESDRWMTALGPLRKEVEEHAIERHSLNDSGVNIHKPQLDKNVEIFDVFDSGVIVVKGGRVGQLLLLVPTMSGQNVTWRCMVGGKDAMPVQCKY